MLSIKFSIITVIIFMCIICLFDNGLCVLMYRRLLGCLHIAACFEWL